MIPGRFPAPWSAVELHEAFRIEDAKGFPIAYVYFADPDMRAELHDRDKRF